MQSNTPNQLLFTFIFACFLPRLLFADRPQSDFNSDGTSEPVLIQTEDSNLKWHAISVESGNSSQIGDIGKSGEHIILADWLGTGIPQIGTVSIASDEETLSWKILNGDSESSKTFGEANDLAMSDADFNGDGINDAAIVRKSGSKLNWQINKALFSGSDTTIISFNFCARTEIPFYFSTDGIKDLAACIRRRGSKNFLLRTLDIETNEVKRVIFNSNFGTLKGKLRPFPIKSPLGPDNLAISKTYNGETIINFLSISNSSITEKTIAADGDLVVGNFTSDAGEEIAIKDGDNIIIYSQTSDSLTQVTGSLSGIITDEININEIELEEDNSPIPPSDSPAPGLDAVCAARSAIGNGEMLIKSEISKHINRADPRAAGYTVVCSRLCPKNLSRSDFFYADGSYAGSVAYYGTFHGNGRPRLYGAVGEAPQHNAREIAEKAKNIGNGKLYMQMSVSRSGTNTECKEFNPSGRNGGL